MNEWEKEILNSELSEEEKILKYLERIYKEARSECIVKIVELDMRQDFQNISSIVYQKKYQEAILSQINGTLSTLQNDSFSGISDYLNKCYENGYIGAMYDISKQGIPIITPIDSKMVANAIINDSKLSVSMYERLGENVEDLKIRVKTRVSMGIANGQSWAEVASKLANDMNSPFKIAQNNVMRIARTEGGRVQSQAQMDACLEAESKGAKIVKQWDSILDGRTREAHRAIDGEIRELHDPFSNGLMMPRDKDGSAEEVINCRCAMLQRAKWALDEEELEKLEEKARFHGFVDEDGNITLNSYNEFKEKFLNYSKMASEDSIDWGVRVPNLSAEEIKYWTNYAKSKNVEFAGLRQFEGETTTLKNLVDEASKMVEKYPKINEGKHRLILEFNSRMNSDDFAITNKRVIWLNADAFKDIEKLASEYNKKMIEGWFVNGTDYKSILIHEIGHVVENVYNIDGLSIAKKTTGISNNDELMDYLLKNLSEYSSLFPNGEEIISECFSSVYNSNEKNTFALNFVEKCDNLIKD